MQGFGNRISVGGVGPKIGRINDERVSFPMAARISHPRPDVLGKMRACVNGNNADVMDHFDLNYRASAILNDLVSAVVRSGKQWRSGLLSLETTLIKRPAPKTFRRMQ